MSAPMASLQVTVIVGGMVSVPVQPAAPVSE